MFDIISQQRFTKTFCMPGTVRCCLCIYGGMFVCESKDVCVYKYIGVFVYMYVGMDVCVCVRAHVHVCTRMFMWKSGINFRYCLLYLLR